MNIEEIQERRKEIEQQASWRSCCFNIDPQACIFFSQLIISIGCIGFAIYQLLDLQDCPSQQAYMALLMMILGVWLPSPRLNKK